MQLIQQKVVSGEGEDRVQGVTLISALAEVAGEQVKVNLKDFLGLFRKTLQDTELEVCYHTIVALTYFVCQTSSDEVALLSATHPSCSCQD